jgi:hypothetical protein
VALQKARDNSAVSMVNRAQVSLPPPKPTFASRFLPNVFRGVQQPAPSGAAQRLRTSRSAAARSWAAANGVAYPSRRELNRR